MFLRRPPFSGVTPPDPLKARNHAAMKQRSPVYEILAIHQNRTIVQMLDSIMLFTNRVCDTGFRSGNGGLQTRRGGKECFSGGVYLGKRVINRKVAHIFPTNIIHQGF